MKLFSLLSMFATLSAGVAQLGGLGGLGSLPAPPAPAAPSLPAGLPTADICAIFTLAGGGLAANLVKSVCDMAKNWLKGLPEAGSQLPQYSSVLTPAQRKYWNSVVQCQDIQCLCDYWPKCKGFTVDVGHGGRKTNVSEVASYVKRYGTTTRKEIRSLTDVERRRFFYALNKLKYDKIDGWSKYDILTGYHLFIPFIPQAHFSAGLLPFHRELLKNLEIALRMEHPLTAFPYWDSSLDSELPNPKDTVLFLDELMGSGDGNVTDGPFSVWTGQANSKFPVPIYLGGITRAFGAAQGGTLYTKEYLDIILNKPSLKDLVFCFDPFLDTIHAAVHVYVGGLMADPATSPGDPLFYLHHCFIDYIWNRWRHKHQKRAQRETEFAPPCPYNPFDLPITPLHPFSVTIKDGYSNKYTDEFYKYQKSPTCAHKCHNSTFLVCNPKKDRCMSKIRLGGDCTGFETLDICYKGKCKGGVCVKS